MKEAKQRRWGTCSSQGIFHFEVSFLTPRNFLCFLVLCILQLSQIAPLHPNHPCARYALRPVDA